MHRTENASAHNFIDIDIRRFRVVLFFIKSRLLLFSFSWIFSSFFSVFSPTVCLFFIVIDGTAIRYCRRDDIVAHHILISFSTKWKHFDLYVSNSEIAEWITYVLCCAFFSFFKRTNSETNNCRRFRQNTEQFCHFRKKFFSISAFMKSRWFSLLINIFFVRAKWNSECSMNASTNLSFTHKWTSIDFVVDEEESKQIRIISISHLFSQTIQKVIEILQISFNWIKCMRVSEEETEKIDRIFWFRDQRRTLFDDVEWLFFAGSIFYHRCLTLCTNHGKIVDYILARLAEVKWQLSVYKFVSVLGFRCSIVFFLLPRLLFFSLPSCADGRVLQYHCCVCNFYSLQWTILATFCMWSTSTLRVDDDVVGNAPDQVDKLMPCCANEEYINDVEASRIAYNVLNNHFVWFVVVFSLFLFAFFTLLVLSKWFRDLCRRRQFVDSSENDLTQLQR